MRRIGRPVVLVLALLAVGCGETGGGTTTTSESVEAAPSFEVVRDVSYWEHEFRHILDVWLPVTDEKPVPTILAIHGGGWRDGSKNFYNRLGRHYAESGFAFVAMNYRLAPDFAYPAQVEDSFCALAWLHDNAAEYGFDTDRVVVWGGSAGGYLASMIATVDDPSVYLEDCPNEYPSSDAIQAAVIFYGLFDFTDVGDFPVGVVTSALPRLWGAPYEEIPAERLEEMSPIAQIDGTEQPFLVLHGTADAAIPSVMSERFAAALDEAGVDVELVLVPDALHAFEQILTVDDMAPTFSKISEFLDRYLEP